MKKLLIANRGEIALRIVRAAQDLGIATVAIHARDDADSPHLRVADETFALEASGPAAYLDIDAVVAAGVKTGCDAVHPGYGFLSERADFAAACAKAGIRFVGPDVSHLALFGDKSTAIELARRCKVPVMPSTRGGASLDEITAFFDEQVAQGAGIVIKAVGGGGGRGMRAIESRDALPEAFARCTSEARAAFGMEALYGERLIARARHIEVQIAADGGEAIALGERDCTLQRRFQKLVEIAPSPALSPALRTQIIEAALKMARDSGYRSLGTFEFLVDESGAAGLPFVFIEANPRLQVEHTITEEVTGVDLVAIQLGIASGRSLRDLGLDPASPPPPKGFAIQLRINAESLDAQGLARPASGALERFDIPSGPGVRMDTHARAGYAPASNYDTLLGKLIVTTRSGEFADAVRRARRALRELDIAGIASNVALLRAVTEREDFASQQVHTRHFEAILPELVTRAVTIQAELDARRGPASAAAARPQPATATEVLDAGHEGVRAPMIAKVSEIGVAVGDRVRSGQTVAVVEAMKMEHTLAAPCAGRVVAIRVAPADQVAEEQVLVVIERSDTDDGPALQQTVADPRAVRPDLQRVIDRHRLTLDEARPEAVAKRHGRGHRTARENIADLCDADSFIEYGALTFAAQTKRRTVEDLAANTPADGIITGIGTINGGLFGPERSRCVVMSYDFMVLAGTQGMRGHDKTDRMLEVAHRHRLPTILFAEGGGGRPGDVDLPQVAGLDVTTFAAFARLSGVAPVIGIVTGRCFAGNAALLGCCDVIIATRDSNIGMGGPAMIEGGGLGVYKPEDIGPSRVQHRNGVIDILVEDEAEAVAVAKRYLSVFQGRTGQWESPDPLLLRAVVPENRLRAYDTRTAMQGVADLGSIVELRTGFGIGIHTALARIDGRPVGMMANNPYHLGGAIDADAADKAARFMQLCDAHGLPMVSFVDTPGFMVGPEIEEKAQVRHVCRMFVAAASLRVPFFSIVLRKGYGLGAQSMTAGGFHSPTFNVSWPTGEFGGMGLEGAVRLGFKKELDAVPEGPERDALYTKLVDQQYAKGVAINMAAYLEIDAVIDPAETRKWVVAGLDSAATAPAQPVAAHRYIDTW